MLRTTGAIAVLALLATGCSARSTAHFPGSSVPPAPAAQAPADSVPEPAAQPDPTAELAAPSIDELPVPSEGDGFVEQESQSAAIDDALALATIEGRPPTQEATEAVTADLETITHDIEIPLNAKVLSFVQLFSGRLKAFLEEGLSRGAQYLPMIQEVFRAEGLPLDLAYVPLVESAFKPTAMSRAKAKGIWQFMRGTGLENGLAHDWYVDERAEPEKATLAAAKYLKTLGTMFNGDWHLALASYNGGPGRVQRAIRRSGRTDFWKLSASTKYLPRETRDYVPLILAAIIVAKSPAQYGMNVQPVEPPRSEAVTLAGAVDLRRIAEWIGTSIEALQGLNPELRRWTTPVRATDYELKVPSGTGDIIRAHLAETDPEELTSLTWHTVKKGETLLSIAKKLKVTRADLADANYISARSKVKVGQRLIIPRAPALLLASRPDDPPSGTGPGSTDAVVAADTTVPEAEPARQAPLVHRVKRGDTLFGIARLYRTTVASLKSWNGLRTNAIRVGQRLTIFPESATIATN